MHFLQTQKVKAIVIACNTASAYALDELEKETNVPIIGVVKPGASVAIKTTQNKKIGVIATEGTIHSNLYQTLIHHADPEIQVFGKPCPLFVSLVEEGWTSILLHMRLPSVIWQNFCRRILTRLLWGAHTLSVAEIFASGSCW